MKALKYLFIAALTAGFGTAAMAQDGTKADVDALKKIVSSKPADLEKQIKPFYKENKKNPENLTAFGRVFFEAKDTANARIYAEYALQAVTVCFSRFSAKPCQDSPRLPCIVLSYGWLRYSQVSAPFRKG